MRRLLLIVAFFSVAFAVPGAAERLNASCIFDALKPGLTARHQGERIRVRPPQDVLSYDDGDCSVSFTDGAIELVVKNARIKIIQDRNQVGDPSGTASWNGGRGRKYVHDLGAVYASAGEDGLCWWGLATVICYEGLDPE